MADEVLVFAEYQNGRLARSTFEAVAAAQSVARSTGGAAASAILGSHISGLVSDLARLKVEAVIAVESTELQEYTADGYAHPNWLRLSSEGSSAIASGTVMRRVNWSLCGRFSRESSMRTSKL
jgi:electron transfer flavoprotein alpha subunit